MQLDADFTLSIIISQHLKNIQQYTNKQPNPIFVEQHTILLFQQFLKCIWYYQIMMVLNLLLVNDNWAYQMTLFTNPNFIDHIVKSQGADSDITQDQYPILQTLVELETRLLIETAIKFMRNDRRDSLNIEDITLAAKENMHPQMVLTSHAAQYQTKNQQIFRIDKTYASPELLFEEEMKVLGISSLDEPKLKGQWIYIKGKVPQTIDNANLKTLAQLTSAKEHENQEKKKLFNLIRDEGISIVTQEQTEYFKKMAQIIYSNSVPSGGFIIQGNLSRLFPFFLAFVAAAINEAGILFLMKAIKNKFINHCLEYSLKRILNIFLAYKGNLSFTVGEAIAELVQKFANKYPILLNLYDGYQETSYSTFLKKIAFQLRLGVTFEIDESFLNKCKEDSDANDSLAALCMRTLLTHASRLKQFREFLYKKNGSLFCWLPCTELRSDPYLGSL